MASENDFPSVVEKIKSADLHPGQSDAPALELTPALVLSCALLYMLLSNGEVDDSEISQLQSVIGKNADLLHCAVHYVEAVSIEQFLRDAPQVLKAPDKLCVLTNLCDTMLSDGRVDAAELELFHRFEAAFGFSESAFAPFYEPIALKNNKSVLGVYNSAELGSGLVGPHLALAASLIYTMASDGSLGPEEIGRLQAMIGEFDGLQKFSVKYALRVKSEQFFASASKILSTEQRMFILANACDIMLADGVVEAGEQRVFNAMREAFGISEDGFKACYRAVKIKNIKSFSTDDFQIPPGLVFGEPSADETGDRTGSSAFGLTPRAGAQSTEESAFSATVDRTMRANIIKVVTGFGSSKKIDRLNRNALGGSAASEDDSGMANALARADQQIGRPSAAGRGPATGGQGFASAPSPFDDSGMANALARADQQIGRPSDAARGSATGGQGFASTSPKFDDSGMANALARADQQIGRPSDAARGSATGGQGFASTSPTFDDSGMANALARADQQIGRPSSAGSAHAINRQAIPSTLNAQSQQQTTAQASMAPFTGEKEWPSSSSAAANGATGRHRAQVPHAMAGRPARPNGRSVSGRHAAARSTAAGAGQRNSSGTQSAIDRPYDHQQALAELAQARERLQATLDRNAGKKQAAQTSASARQTAALMHTTAASALPPAAATPAPVQARSQSPGLAQQNAVPSVRKAMQRGTQRLLAQLRKATQALVAASPSADTGRAPAGINGRPVDQNATSASPVAALMRTAAPLAIAAGAGLVASALVLSMVSTPKPPLLWASLPTRAPGLDLCGLGNTLSKQPWLPAASGSCWSLPQPRSALPTWKGHKTWVQTLPVDAVRRNVRSLPIASGFGVRLP